MLETRSLCEELNPFRSRRSALIHDVVAAVYRGGYRIELEFDDGERGVVDFYEVRGRGGFLNSSRIWGFSGSSLSIRNSAR
jgi:hypothetical protein